MSEVLKLELNIPISNIKLYKVEKNLKQMIDVVTKDYNHENSYYNVIDGVENYTLVFKFYNKETFDKVVSSFNNLNQTLKPKKD